MTRAKEQPFVEYLRQALSADLPGRQGQRLFSPELSYGRHFGPPHPDVRQAAVVILLYPHQAAWHLPLTVRHAHLSVHAGQVSLPGGMQEPGETLAETAIRELVEELGEQTAPAEIIGQLTPLNVFNSNFLITPYVAHLPDRPEFSLSQAEVQRLIELPLAALQDAEYRSAFQITRGLLSFTAPCLSWQRDRVWGATSMILGELLSILSQLP